MYHKISYTDLIVTSPDIMPCRINTDEGVQFSFSLSSTFGGAVPTAVGIDSTFLE